MAAPTENPFASRHVRPGALPFLSPKGGADTAELVELLESNGWRGTVLGPHGSGKSTLLRQLATELAGRYIGVEFRQVGRHEPSAARRAAGHAELKQHVLLVDGFDQLPAWRRQLVRWHCGWRNRGLVVTSHLPVGLPVLYRTRTSAALARRLVRALAGEAFLTAAAGEIQQSFTRHDGNLREVLFDLYDLYERNWRRRPTGEHASQIIRVV